MTRAFNPNPYKMGILSNLFLVLIAPRCLAIPYSQYILAPPSRTVYASVVHQVNGTVTNADALTVSGSKGTTTFQGPSSVTLDFGKNIAGLVSIVAGNASASDALIWLTYTESSAWINGNASDAAENARLDSPLSLHVGQGPGTYTIDQDHARGGFRYLSLVCNTTDTIDVNAVTVNFTAAPDQDLQAYTGYFHSNDELVNRIWYAGAYTNQLCSIDPTHGNSGVHLNDISSTDNISLPETDSWYLNYTITNGTSCLVDGAKRDRLVWPGDMAISLNAIAFSTYDMATINNSIQTLFVLQDSDGRLPYVGVPVSSEDITSFTYHLHNLIAVAGYYKYTGDLQWLRQYWGQYKAGLGWSLSFVDGSGLMNVTAAADWLRVGMGGHNIEANAILYFVLQQALELAASLNDTTDAQSWTTYATNVKAAANSLLWDSSVNLYKDNENSTTYPQDGNSWAVRSNLTQLVSQAQNISSALQARWGPYGAPAPEGGATPDVISPFVGGFELEAHYVAGQAQYAVDLVRLQWGFMLDDPRMTNSTFIEGYSVDGSLNYAPYPNGPRVSYSHGWSTGPTYVLTTYAAGIQLTSTQGATWTIAPSLGGLKSVEAGHSTGLGSFNSSVRLIRRAAYRVSA